MLTVSLHEIKYHGFHGWYPEEKLLGNDFLIDVDVKYFPQPGKLVLDELVDYEQLYELVIARLKVSAELLEQLCWDIITEIKARYPYIKSSRVQIRKLHPPLTGEVGNSSVCWEENYD